MTRIEFSPSTKGAMDVSFPKLIVRMDKESRDMKDILRKAVQATLRWLFTPDSTPLAIRSITVGTKSIEKSLKPPLHSDSDMDCIVRDDQAFIHLSSDYLEAVQSSLDAGARELVCRDIHNAICYILNPQFDDDSYPQQFYQGFSSYVMLKEGFHFDSSDDYNGPTSEYIWYGRKMPHFLDWLSKQHGENAIRRLNASFKAPYDNSVFETVTGKPVSTLWKMYCAAQAKHGNDGEELNAELSTLWPIPEVEYFFDLDRGFEHEGTGVFFSTINPLDALTHAVLATFKCLYTPKTVPTNVKKISLVLQSGPMENPIGIRESAEDSHCELMISLDWIKFEKPSAQIIKRLLVFCISSHYLNSTDGHRSWSSKFLKQGISVYALMKEGLVTPYTGGRKGNEADGDARLFANFLFWIESTVREGTVKKINGLMDRYDYDPLWFETLTGKSLEQLCEEYQAAFPDAYLPEELIPSKA